MPRDTPNLRRSLIRTQTTDPGRRPQGCFAAVGLVPVFGVYEACRYYRTGLGGLPHALRQDAADGWDDLLGSGDLQRKPEELKAKADGGHAFAQFIGILNQAVLFEGLANDVVHRPARVRPPGALGEGLAAGLLGRCAVDQRVLERGAADAEPREAPGPGVLAGHERRGGRSGG